MTKDRLFRQEYAKELLAVAVDDLEAAEVLQNANISRKENVLFHVQQSIEKALKAGLCWHRIPVPLVHELALIVDRFPVGHQPPRAEDIVDLTQFATIRRYEQGVAEFSNEEIQDCFDLARQILSWVSDQIESLPKK